MGKLDGKVALITGASGDIGRAAAQLFVDEGAELWITGRDEARITGTARDIGTTARPICADLGSLDDVARIFTTVGEQSGRLDVLYLSAAAVDIHLESDSATPAQFDAVFDVNVRAAFFAVQHALPMMPRGASIVLTGSIATERGIPGQIAYAASKAALGSMARTWSVELAGRGVRANCLVPGAIESGESVHYPDEVREGIRARIPLARFGAPGELARAALFLACEDSSFVTGAELTVDGGVTRST